MKYFPNYLRRCIDENIEEINLHYSAGKIKCECGNNIFELLFPGATVNIKNTPYPCTLEKDNTFFFLIKVKCITCSRRYLLFDQDFHGWDGHHCHNSKQASLPRPDLVLWKCIRCGNKQHTISIKLELPERDEYEEDTQWSGKKFNEEDWLLDFEWIWISISCTHCGLRTNDWVSYETA